MTDSDTTSDDSPEVEIVEQDIIDLTIQVGSNCEWIGTGSEPQWDNPKSTMSNDAKFEWRLGAPCLENYAAPPEDTLGELSHFEFGLRRFCYECNREVSIEIGGEKIQVFLDPDICMLLEDELPKRISELLNNKPTEIEFVESCCLAIELVPSGSKISCNLKEFGYLLPNNFTLSYRKKSLELDRTQVLVELKQFVNEVMEMAVDGGYITTKEKQEFLMPIADTVSPSVVSQ